MNVEGGSVTHLHVTVDFDSVFKVSVDGSYLVNAFVDENGNIVEDAS